MKTHLFLLSIIILALGCEGPEGPEGPEGLQGPPGVTLIAEYTGIIDSSSIVAIQIPEIKNRQTSTFVMAYWSFPENPDLWIPMTDGWIDEAGSQIIMVTWIDGGVILYDMVEGHHYLIQVFEHY